MHIFFEKRDVATNFLLFARVLSKKKTIFVRNEESKHHKISYIKLNNLLVYFLE